MQQTEKYKLNLIESSDPFLPTALNDNTQKVEDLISAHQDGVAAELDARILKLAYGYAEKGSAGSITVHLPFTPKAVLVDGPVGEMGEAVFLGVEGSTLNSAYRVELLESGFRTKVSGPIHYAAFG